MIYRLVTPLLFVVCIAGLLLANVVVASESRDGTVEKAGSGKITIKDKEGTSQTFEVDSGAKITLDGKTAKLDDLPAGSSATVTTETKGNKTVAVMVVARSKL